jgi:hypothetical protein
MGVPASACFKILMIKLSEYLDVFIENLLKSRLFDFLLLNSIIFREDYRAEYKTMPFETKVSDGIEG